jgi:hypothetical protein
LEITFQEQGTRVWGFRFMVYGLGFRVRGSGFRVQGLELSEFGSGLGFRV